MIIVLHGKDSFRTAQKLKEIISGYYKKNKNGINLKHLDDDITFEDLKNEGRQVGMFEEKKLLIGIDLLLRKELKKEIINNFNKIKKQENILILKESQKIDKELVDLMESLPKNYGIIKEYSILTGKKLDVWYRNQFVINKAKIEEDALRKIVEYVGNDLWRASNEIKKLSNLKFSENITKEDVLKYVRSSIETDIFETIDKLGQGNKKEATELLEKHLKKGDSAFYVLSMIDYQLRNLLIIKELQEKGLSEAEIKTRSKLSYFVFKKAREQSSKFSFKELKKIHREIFRVDLNSKIGKITPETGLALIISQF